MTAREWIEKNAPENIDPKCFGGIKGCPSRYNLLEDPGNCMSSELSCRDCWNRLIIDDEKVEHPDTDTPKKYVPNLFYQQLEEQSRSDEAGPRILDSGNRRQFESGAVRDIQEGKGRCDLLPLDVVSEFLDIAFGDHDESYLAILDDISEFQQKGRVDKLHDALITFTAVHTTWGNFFTMLLEVAKHFEEGCNKYGENNWQKGIPVHCYIDSGVRHYLKFLRGDKDEPHDRAFCWNMLCAIWTCKHKPELNEYRKED